MATATLAPSSAPTTSASSAANPVIEAFLASFAQTQPPFHLDCTVTINGSIGGNTEHAKLAMSGDVSDQNFSGEMRIEGKRVVVRIVGGRGYARLPGGEWKIEPIHQTQPLNPMAGLVAADLEWVGKKALGGRRLDLLRTHKWIGNDPSRRLRQCQGRLGELDLFVDADGLPVEATLDFIVSGKLYGDDARYSAHVVYKFSHVGEDVEIIAPT